MEKENDAKVTEEQQFTQKEITDILVFLNRADVQAKNVNEFVYVISKLNELNNKSIKEIENNALRYILIYLNTIVIKGSESIIFYNLVNKIKKQLEKDTVNA